MNVQTALTLRGPEADLHALAARFEALYGDEGLPVCVFQAEPDRAEGSPWCLSLYAPTHAADEWIDRLGVLAHERGLPSEIEEEAFGDTDWLALTLEELAPVRAGRFVVHGRHDREHVHRAGAITVEVEAGLAFGSGHHGTTAGCLELLDAVLSRMGPSRPCRVLDVGTGSAVLAIAAAKAARVPVLATDIDPVAVRVARENAASNGVAPWVRLATAPGFAHPAFRRFGAADIAMANILAGPLRRLARPMRAHLAPGAAVILSGLLPHQRAGVLAFYRLQDLVLERAIERNGWTSLLLRAPKKKGGRFPDGKRRLRSRPRPL